MAAPAFHLQRGSAKQAQATSVQSQQATQLQGDHGRAGSAVRSSGAAGGVVVTAVIRFPPEAIKARAVRIMPLCMCLAKPHQPA